LTGLPCGAIEKGRFMGSCLPSISVDGSAVGCTQVVVDPFPASRNEPAGVHTEVGTRVHQKLPFSKSVHNEEAACRCSADMCRR
jgi:hypothetical protein